MERSEESLIVPPRTALVVIDVQNDFCHENGALSKAGKDISRIQVAVHNLKKFIDAARQYDLAIIFVRTIHDQRTNSKAYLHLNQLRKRSSICLPDTWGSQFYLIKPKKSDCIITKNRYSVFIGTNLEMILRCMNIDTILFAGIMTNVCVESSLRDAFNRDFSTVLVEDCAGTDQMALHEATVANVREYFGVVASASILIEHMTQDKRSQL